LQRFACLTKERHYTDSAIVLQIIFKIEKNR